MLFDPGCSNCGCPTPGTAYRVRITSCSQPLPGVVVDLWTSSGMTVLRGSETTDSGGYATFYLTSGGSAYAHVPSTGSARINPGGATITLSTTTPPVVFLTAATGFTCCYNGACGPPSPVPRGKLRVTTSSGSTWDFTGCNSAQCVETDDVPIGPDSTVAATVTNGSGGSCGYQDFPTLTIGRKQCKVLVNLVSGVWRFGLSQAPILGYERRDPMTYARCTGSDTSASDVLVKYWVTSDVNCATTSYPLTATGVVVSCDPLVVTGTFSVPGSAWEGSYWSAGGGGFLTPPVLASVTLTELP